MSLSSALSITQSVNPSRAVFTDFPLGHTAGRPHDAASQGRIVTSALRLLKSASGPGAIEMLDLRWADTDDWKDSVMRTGAGERGTRQGDDRVARHASAQYQDEDDAAAADPDCPTCVWLDDTSR